MRLATLRLLVVGLVFLLGAGAAHALNVNIVNGNVISIEGLLIHDESGTPTLHDVHFVDATGFDVYGQFLDYDFTIDGNAILARQAIEQVLNLNSTVPTGAGPGGSSHFWIPFDDDNDLTVAVGEQYDGLIPDEWELCQDGCLVGFRALIPSAINTYAKFSPASIPEPGTALLLGLGLAGLGAVGRRRRKGSERTA